MTDCDCGLPSHQLLCQRRSIFRINGAQTWPRSLLEKLRVRQRLRSSKTSLTISPRSQWRFAAPSLRAEKPSPKAKKSADKAPSGHVDVGDIKKAAAFVNAIGGLDKAIALLQILKVAKEVQ